MKPFGNPAMTDNPSSQLACLLSDQIWHQFDVRQVDLRGGTCDSLAPSVRGLEGFIRGSLKRHYQGTP